jgi:site-specific recombinase XerD
MKLSQCLLPYFEEYLPNIKGASPETIKTYRDAFGLFLLFAAKHNQMVIKDLEVEHLSFELIFAFLNHLEKDRNNQARTRNNRLAALKSLAKMIRMLYPEHRETADMILNIPQKRGTKKLIGYLTHDEVMTVLSKVDLGRKEGFRDYAILHLLYNSGARASEVADLKLDYLDLEKKTLAILGKGNRYRMIEIWPKTADILKRYIEKYRPRPKPLCREHLFINQRREPFTRHGIHRLCCKYLEKSLPDKKRQNLNPAHSFRHSCAMNLLVSGYSLTDIKNHLGHEKLSSTMVYLQMNVSRKKEVQKKFIEYTRSRFKQDRKIEALIDWENKEETLKWLDEL